MRVATSYTSLHQICACRLSFTKKEDMKSPSLLTCDPKRNSIISPTECHRLYQTGTAHIITYCSKSKDQPGKVANPARGQPNRKKRIFSSPHSRMRIWSREMGWFGSHLPRQPAHLHTQADAYLRDSSRFPRRRPFIYLNRHTPSSQSQVSRVTQLRTDGVHCREYAGTGPVNLKVVQIGAALAGHHGPINVRLSFPHPLLV